MICLRTCVALGILTYAQVGAAQPAQGTPVCIPGTQVCGSADGHGGVQVNASGSAQVTPNGANASGQAGAQGSAGANANGNANANANANGNANGNANRNGNGNGNANGNGNGHATRPPPPSYSGGESSHYEPYTGRFGVGVAGCAVVRAGIWSGYKAGGCVAVSFRFEGLTFEMETQLLYGGTTHAFDWTFPLSFMIPLGNESSLFDGGYLRFGGSPVGATFARKQDGGDFVRFGLFAGAGYELEINRSLSWRVIDARASFDMGTRRSMDRLDHWVDLGMQLSTGLVL